MAKIVRLNDEQLSALCRCIENELFRTIEGREPADIEVRYLGSLLEINKKVLKEDEST